MLKQDDLIDQEFDGLLRKLITYMMEDPRTISASIDLVFVAKAIERVGDHAKNMAERSSTSSRAPTCATTRSATVETTGALRQCTESTMSRVLVVEDESAIAELIAINLRHAGFEVTHRRRRRAGAGARSTRVLPDLVLLDWMLPGQRGLQLAQRWRGDAAHRELPIIMLTARADEADKVAGLDAGADDYLTKPFSTQELLARIRAVLRRTRARGARRARSRSAALRLDPATHRVTRPTGSARSRSARPSSGCCTS